MWKTFFLSVYSFTSRVFYIQTDIECSIVYVIILCCSCFLHDNQCFRVFKTKFSLMLFIFIHAVCFSIPLWCSCFLLNITFDVVWIFFIWLSMLFYFFVATAAVLVFTWLLVFYVGFSCFIMRFIYSLFFNSITQTIIY